MRKDIYINDSCTILQAMQQIESNKERIVFVVDDELIFKGIVTDGDIRRYIIKHKTIFDLSIKIKSVMNTRVFYLTKENLNIHHILEAFKGTKINVIPIIDTKKRLVDYITKEKFHSHLLQNKITKINNLGLLKNINIEQEIHNRPWGFYKSILLTKYVQCKTITVFPEQSLSFQKHLRREEHWVIVFGSGNVILENSKIQVYSGKYIYIPMGCKHRIVNTSKKQNLIFCEVQLGDYFGEDDIIRYEDQYNRK